MHTYTGASTRALMAGEAVLDTLPNWFEHVAHMNNVFAEIFSEIENLSQGRMICHGQGMMWGGLWKASDHEERKHATAIFKKHCNTYNVWPYFVPVGGFMTTPPLDTSESDMREAGNRLAQAMQATIKEIQ